MVAHIGDRDHNDVKGAQALGAKAILFTGTRPADKETTSADGICEHHRDLPAIIDRLGLSADRYEFQMLLGVENRLRRILTSAGHKVRVYVPYGSHWYQYSTRRLRENPKIAGHVLRALLRGE